MTLSDMQAYRCAGSAYMQQRLHPHRCYARSPLITLHKHGLIMRELTLSSASVSALLHARMVSVSSRSSSGSRRMPSGMHAASL